MDLDFDIGEMVDRLAPSVVEVRAGSGVGAGVIWRPDGLIVTNDHVAPRESVEIRLSNGHALIGQVVARDRGNDLAVVGIVLGSLPAAEARPEPVRTGELALAIGHPFGVRYAVAFGIVSTTEAIVEGPGRMVRKMIRADVPLGPGNSGGPLVDARGRVIGINAMIGGGMALAVPSALAEGLVRTVAARAAA